MATAVLLLAALAVVILGLGLGTGRFRAVPVLSGSMRPDIQPGDVAFLTPVDADSIGRDDVIIFEAPVGDHHLVLHRVLRVESDGSVPVVITKGDANERRDPWRARLQGDVVWRYRGRIPYVGHVALWARQPSVRFASIAVATLVMLWIALRMIWRSGARLEEVGTGATG